MHKKIVLMGGLGNQLFQYARAISFGKPVELIDMVPLNRRNLEDLPDICDYRLDSQIVLVDPENSSIKFSKVFNLAIRLSSRKTGSLKFKNLISELLSLQTLFLYRQHLSFQITHGLDDFQLSSKADCVIGYFQNSLAADFIRKVGLELKDPSPLVELYKEKAQSELPLVVHYRLTDYTQEDVFGLPDSEYYLNAIRWMKSKENFAKIWVFSDDIDKAKELFPLEFQDETSFIFEPSASSAETLEIMRLGHGFVIANSSFSWWAASLSRSENPKVVCPEPWFSGRDNPIGIIPNGWAKMNKDPKPSSIGS